MSFFLFLYSNVPFLFLFSGPYIILTRKQLSVLFKEKYLIVIVGPTAVGKTAVSISLAKTFRCDIISADSRQFYKEMKTGTAKPDEEEMMGIRHHFINTHSVREEFSAGRFEQAVLQLLEKLFTYQNPVIMTGGSGLYVQAVCEGMNDIPPVSGDIRKKLYEELAKKGLEPLVEELRQKDPVYFERVDKKNRQRVIRALEVCRATGRPYSSFRNDEPRKRDFKMIKIGLDLPRELLFDRIDRRVDQMVTDGLFEEAEQLLPYRNQYALQSVGYREVFGFLDGRYDRQEAVRLIKRNTRRYAKRQLTWFRRDREIRWFEPRRMEEMVGYIREQMKI